MYLVAYDPLASWPHIPPGCKVSLFTLLQFASGPFARVELVIVESLMLFPKAGDKIRNLGISDLASSCCFQKHVWRDVEAGYLASLISFREGESIPQPSSACAQRDDSQRQALQEAAAATIDNEQWVIATLPISKGALGMQQAEYAAEPARLASRLAAAPVGQEMLPPSAQALAQEWASRR